MKIVAEVKNVHITIEERVSAKTNKSYRVMCAVINGQKVDLGFVNVYSENALLRVGVKFNN